MIQWKKRKLLALFPQVQAVQSLSKDPNTKTSALIIDENYTVLSSGYNGLPRLVDETPPERHSRENGEKYYWYEHAERNAIYNAIRTHADIRGAHMLLSEGPGICCDCARGIIQSMIKTIILINNSRITNTNPMWSDHHKRTEMMFAETGVELVYIDQLT